MPTTKPTGDDQKWKVENDSEHIDYEKRITALEKQVRLLMRGGQ